jgi:hypothetical protein
VATIKQVVQGSYPAQTVHFERGWSSCDDALPPPKVGEAWVIYFWKRAEGDQPVWQTYPATVAYAADSVLASSVGFPITSNILPRGRPFDVSR